MKWTIFRILHGKPLQCIVRINVYMDRCHTKCRTLDPTYDLCRRPSFPALARPPPPGWPPAPAPPQHMGPTQGFYQRLGELGPGHTGRHRGWVIGVFRHEIGMLVNKDHNRGAVLLAKIPPNMIPGNSCECCGCFKRQVPVSISGQW